MIWGNAQALSELVVVLGEDSAVDQVLVFYDQLPGLRDAAAESWGAVREGIVEGARRSPVPTMVCSTLPELLDDQSAWRFTRAGIAAASGLRTGLRCIAAMASEPGDPRRLREIARLAHSTRAEDGAGAWLAENEAKELLRHAGIAVAEGRVVRGERDVVLALDELGGRIALKVSAPDLRHKSELGAVLLGIASADQAIGAYLRLAAIAAEYGGTVTAESMVPPGLELLIAAKSDAVVPAVVLAMGGLWTEVLSDVAIVPLPASAARIARALHGLRGAPALFGGRGQQPLDVDAVSLLAQRAGEVLVEASLELVELNPVVVAERGAVAVDAVVRRRASRRSAVGISDRYMQCTT